MTQFHTEIRTSCRLEEGNFLSMMQIISNGEIAKFERALEFIEMVYGDHYVLKYMNDIEHIYNDYEGVSWRMDYENIERLRKHPLLVSARANQWEMFKYIMSKSTTYFNIFLFEHLYKENLDEFADYIISSKDEFEIIWIVEGNDAEYVSDDIKMKIKKGIERVEAEKKK